MNIKLLDCTLRDGGYVNDWGFTESQVCKIINSLDESNIDIIELGYLDEKRGGRKNSTLFKTAYSVGELLEGISIRSKKVVMIDLFAFDLDKLPKQTDTKIDGIRLAFHKKDIKDAFLAAKKIIDLGYLLFFQPMVTKTYTNNEFLSMIKFINQLDIYAFYIVDSFGSMTLMQLQKFINLAENNLARGIKLGYHSHNNMQLAFSNAIDICNSNIDREFIIDSSIYGMGRGAGNLNTELIANYLSKTDKYKFKVMPLLEVIDEVLSYYFKQSPWGFTPAQYLSASLDCHPNYSSYLVNKRTTHIADIQKILEKIPSDKKVSFNEQLIDNLYQQYLLTNKSNVKGKLIIPDDKQVLLIASGYSVSDNLDLIRQKIESGNYFVIALNHKPQIDCDYYFFSNQQRFDEFTEQLPREKQVITTNILSDQKIDIVIELKAIAYIENNFITNVAILMINYLVYQSVGAVEIAGLDGYQMGRENYAYYETNIPDNEHLLLELNDTITFSLKALKSLIDIKLITPSFYEEIL